MRTHLQEKSESFCLYWQGKHRPHSLCWQVALPYLIVDWFRSARLMMSDYFRWRQEDASRNALNSHCYWLLRKEGLSVSAASQQLKGASVSDKNELLFSRGINYNDLLLWQKRGVGLYYREEQRQGYNPQTQKATTYMRHALQVYLELPIGQDYSMFIREILEKSK